MPYRRRRRRRRPRRGRKLAPLVRSIIKSQSETKFFDTNVPTATLTAAGGFMLPLFSIPLGDGQNERVGNRVRLIALHLDLKLYNVSNTYFLVRGVLFKRKAPYSTAAVIPVNLIEYTDPDFIVTKKDTLTILGGASEGGSRSIMAFGYNKRWPASSGGQVVVYNGAGATNVTSGMWQVQLATNNTSTVAVFVVGRVRVYYKDM